MTNLLSNAVKFTKLGTVTLALAEEGDGVRILVSDTGCGMETEFQKVVSVSYTHLDGYKRQLRQRAEKSHLL